MDLLVLKIGKLYEKGSTGILRDLDKAITYAKRCIEEGHPLGMGLLFRITTSEELGASHILAQSADLHAPGFKRHIDLYAYLLANKKILVDWAYPLISEKL